MKKTSKKLQKLEQIHGESEQEYAITSVYQLLGDKGNGVYKTDNLEEYEKELNEMNLADLQRHATQYGQIPISDRKRLTNRLINDFVKYWAPFRVKKELTLSKSETNDSNTKISPELQKILNLGK